MPSCASETTSFTPRKPRRASLRRKAVQKGEADKANDPVNHSPAERLGGADVHAEHLAPAVGVDAHRHDDRDRDDAAGLADLHVGGVDPQIRPSTAPNVHWTFGKTLQWSVFMRIDPSIGRSRKAFTRSSFVGTSIHWIDVCTLLTLAQPRDQALRDAAHAIARQS